MVEMIGEPYRRLIVSPSDYPYHHLARKIGYHQSLQCNETNQNEENEMITNKEQTTHLIHSKQPEVTTQPCYCESTTRTL